MAVAGRPKRSVPKIQYNIPGSECDDLTSSDDCGNKSPKKSKQRPYSKIKASSKAHVHHDKPRFERKEKCDKLRNQSDLMSASSTISKLKGCFAYKPATSIINGDLGSDYISDTGTIRSLGNGNMDTGDFDVSPKSSPLKPSFLDFDDQPLSVLADDANDGDCLSINANYQNPQDSHVHEVRSPHCFKHME